MARIHTSNAQRSRWSSVSQSSRVAAIDPARIGQQRSQGQRRYTTETTGYANVRAR